MIYRKTLVLLTYVLVFTLIGLILFCAGYSITRNNRTIVRDPLIVSFGLIESNGEFQGDAIGLDNRSQIGFTLETNSKAQFYFSVNSNTEATQNNVTVCCNFVEEGLVYLDAQNQTYGIPFETKIGSLERLAVSHRYSGFLEAPSKAGLYRMDWNTSSNQFSISFVIYVEVA